MLRGLDPFEGRGAFPKRACVSGPHDASQTTAPAASKGRGGMCYCPCLGLLTWVRDIPQERGGGGALQDLEKNLGLGCCIGGRHPETRARSLLWGNSLHSVLVMGEREQKEVAGEMASFPTLG